MYSRYSRESPLAFDALQEQIHRKLKYRPLQFHKRSQYFIGPHDETLSVTMRVSNPDCSFPNPDYTVALIRRETRYMSVLILRP